MRPRRVLHIISGLHTGGAEVALCRLLEAPGCREYRHSVVCLSREGAMSERVRKAAATLRHLDLAPSKPNPLALIRLRHMVRSEAPDLVHGWMYHANLAATLAVRGSAVPMIWGIRHSLYDLTAEKVLTRLVILLSARMSSRPRKIVYNSDTSARQHQAIGYRPESTQVIPNGFDTVVFKPSAVDGARIRAEMAIPEGALVIGHVARWHPMKDHANLLCAARLYLSSHPNAVFVLVGSGVDGSNAILTAQIRQLGIASSVRLCGRRADIPAINAAFDVASLSSWSEAFPNSVGEAMACGVPCVATDVGEVREIVGPAGVVVPPRDPEALCAGWRRIGEMEVGARRKLAAIARERIVQRYSLAACADAYSELYHEVGAEDRCAV